MVLIKFKSTGYKPKKKKYLSTKACCKYLGCDLEIFRKLCILKGVYPQDSKNKPDATKTYYSVKDLKLMRADPLLYKYFQFETWRKRLRKSVDKEEKQTQVNLLKFSKPEFNYDRLVKERYPTWKACLTDLDDCLSLMFMFRQMPSGHGVNDDMIRTIQQLTDEFITFVVHTRALRRVFVTIRGIYYQASIDGVEVTWLAPFNFPLSISDKDCSELPLFIFEDFLTFYSTTMKFVNYKLFHSIGVSYPLKLSSPPKSDPRSYILNFEQSKVDIERSLSVVQKIEQRVSEMKAKVLQEEILKTVTNNDDTSIIDEKLETVLKNVDDNDDTTKVDAFDDKLNAEAIFLQKSKSIFENMDFYISRESPFNSIEFIIRSFGGNVTTQQNSDQITHYIVDRPNFKPDNRRRCEYLQPQWVFDCVNAQLLLPVHRYKPGEELPPHLSPFVQYKTDSYIPKYAEEIIELKKKEMSNIRLVQNPDALQEPDKEEEENGILELIEQEEDIINAERNYQDELQAERKGVKFSEYVVEAKRREDQKAYNRLVHEGREKKSKSETREDEIRKLKLSMLPKKKQRQYLSAKRRQENIEAYKLNLRQRRAKLDLQERESNEKMDTTEDVMDKVEMTHDGEDMIDDNVVMREEVDDEFAGLDAMEEVADEEKIDLSDEEIEKPKKKSKKRKRS